jgi:hypothetical protein
MTYDAFIESIGTEAQPPQGLSTELAALWQDRKGDWHQAHELCQQEGTASGDRIHAYLHRKEGDEGNASYWYQRAGESKPSCSLEDEWTALVKRWL